MEPIMTATLNVLILEDQPADVELMLYELRRSGFELNPKCVETETDYLACLQPDLDLILSDYTMPQFDAPRALFLLQERDLNVPFIIVTGTISEEAAVACMKQGAADYLIKDRLARLGEAVRHALQQKQLYYEKQQAELALRESEEKFRTIFSKALDVILIVDPDNGQILNANPATEYVLGYQVESLMGQPFTILSPATPQFFDNLLQKFKVQGSVFEFYEFLQADGSTCPMDLTATLIPWNSKQVVLVTLRDATERKQTEAALKKSEEHFRQVISSISDHIYVTEYTATGQRVNHYLSPVETLTGYPIEKLLANWSFWPSCIIHPDDRGLAAAQAERFAQGFNGEVEYRLIRSDGRVIWVRDSGRVERNPVTGNIMVYGVVSDVTERKQAELTLAEERAQLAQRVDERTAELQTANAELARAARLKDEFLAVMSHELRTPLNAILGMSEILRENVYGPLNEAQQNALRHIEEGGRHLLELINDILDLSKIEAGKMELTIAPTSVSSVCRASLRFVQQMAHKKRLKVSSVLDPQVEVIQVDERRLKQVLVNLLTNAVKFTAEGGQIGLEVSGDEGNHVVHFTVWDAGIGIAEGEIGRLFRPFVQIDSSLSRRHEGTGLGLSLVSRLVEMHGGGVSVQSKVGEGSRFTISLPWHAKLDSQKVVSGQQVETPTQVSTPLQTSDFRILLVEDNDINIITMKDFLEAKGYQVILARNGLEAIELAEQELPDLILMDVHLPHMDGLEATRRIRAQEKLAHTPIIALTALAMPGDRERCLSAGMNEYLSKPIRIKMLNEVIQKQLQSLS
jgi:PAS domain S-box-containing protein